VSVDVICCEGESMSGLTNDNCTAAQKQVAVARSSVDHPSLGNGIYDLVEAIVVDFLLKWFKVFFE